MGDEGRLCGLGHREDSGYPHTPAPREMESQEGSGKGGTQSDAGVHRCLWLRVENRLWRKEQEQRETRQEVRDKVDRTRMGALQVGKGTNSKKISKTKATEFTS